MKSFCWWHAVLFAVGIGGH